jgi:fumarylacetoacetate (FAA) hydrolase
LVGLPYEDFEHSHLTLRVVAGKPIQKTRPPQDCDSACLIFRYALEPIAMKFVSFLDKSTSAPSWGVLNDSSKVLELSHLAPSFRSFIEGDWESHLSKIRSQLNTATIAVANIELLAPIPDPPSMRDGYAFRQHVEAARRNRGAEMIPEFDKFPTFYLTNHAAVTGPGKCRVMKEHLKRLDFELEAAIVVGKTCRNVKASEADECIFGYTIMNDWSARALQMEEMKLSLGPAKGKDFNTSLGPWIVTRDELEAYRIPGPTGERYNLAMNAWVNGKHVSTGNLKDMTWTFAQILERVSYGVTLKPGDVIGSGTVGTGCFLELNGSKITDNQWLQVGDTVRLSIDQLGELDHVIELEEGDTPPTVSL